MLLATLTIINPTVMALPSDLQHYGIQPCRHRTPPGKTLLASSIFETVRRSTYDCIGDFAGRIDSQIIGLDHIRAYANN